MSGIEIIHHGVRTVTNGDVRLNQTPEQWDPIPTFIRREVNRKNNSIEAYLQYPDLEYMIRTELSGSSLIISVHINKPIPEKYVNKAGFNLEFLPAAYFGKSYIMDNKTGIFPLYASGQTKINTSGETEPLPLAVGTQITFAPEDSERRIKITSENMMGLYDGRNKAQNGWYVLRSLIPANKTGKVIEWKLEASAIPGWIRQPVISLSQVGYHPDQEKKAVVELDKNDTLLSSADLYQVSESGEQKLITKLPVKAWGYYQRYKYGIIDFSGINREGIYRIQYCKSKSGIIRISRDIYRDAWYSTLDVYMPVQMDHMMVNEAYRVWHGASHLDDALQAPPNHKHFDLYTQGPSTDSPYQPGEHIPGLNTGGWYDAGDYDIRTQTQYATVLSLVHTWEDFRPERDVTYVNQQTRYVDLHHPDGKPDMLQQIEHGTLALIAQYNAVGHAISGIIVPFLSQYTHLGDGLTMTDNLIYKPDLDSLQTDGDFSGTFDDRWAFTTKSTSLDYGSIAALAAAARALKGFNDTLASECLQTAIRVWDEEQMHEPELFHHGNTTGGPLVVEEVKAALELLKSTGDKKYSKSIEERWPEIEKRFNYMVGFIMMSLPYMDESFHRKVETKVKEYVNRMESIKNSNPFGVLITERGWAGNGTVINRAVNNYLIYKNFPDLIEKESVYRGLHYIFGCHPDSDISFVSGVGFHSKKVAYGMNRADYSFIAGGVVPGILILKPDFPENKENWPFLWGENEYVVGLAATYIYLVHAANELLNELLNE